MGASNVDAVISEQDKLPETLRCEYGDTSVICTWQFFPALALELGARPSSKHNNAHPL